jgi:hypothetical protein
MAGLMCLLVLTLEATPLRVHRIRFAYASHPPGLKPLLNKWKPCGLAGKTISGEITYYE